MFGGMFWRRKVVSEGRLGSETLRDTSFNNIFPLQYSGTTRALEAEGSPSARVRILATVRGTRTRFHIHSGDYLVIFYSFRNSCGGLK
ncbi:hypothetical protein E2C01_067917 [Portunus trituberculatus]|uniref:Uncharacterized protein n=1 Tax=Portunus trituberculatus TaxID=210409 RepID=A0A5B7HUC4_PORTR|nr:hypothetical protein [Portunus trituberculatus]